jgi:hypothetical protein
MNQHVKGFRRRVKILQQMGHWPKPSIRSVSESIERERRNAAKSLAAKKKKK